MYGKFNFKNTFLPVLFLVLISFFFLNNIFSFTKDTENKENRTLLKAPPLDINHLDPFPVDYENYYNDNFKLRNFFISAYNLLYIKFYKKSPLPAKVIIGKDGWYFYNAIHGAAYRGLERFSEIELKDFKDELLYRNQYLKKRGIKYYFVIVPTKYTVYPEFIPDGISRFNTITMADQVMSVFKKDTAINIFDMRSVVVDAKKHNIRLYYKTDSHWNFAGGYFCYVNLIERMKKDFPQFQPIGLNNYTIDSVWQKGGDLSRMLGMDDVIKELNIRLTPRFKSTVIAGKKHHYNPGNFQDTSNFETVKLNPQLKGPKALIFVDSYNHGLENYVPQHFSKTVYIWDNWEYKLNEEIVESEKPDVVLTIIAECQLKVILQHMSHKKAL